MNSMLTALLEYVVLGTLKLNYAKNYFENSG